MQNILSPWSVKTEQDGGHSIDYKGRGKDKNGRPDLWSNVLKQREQERLIIEAAPLMLKALKRLTHPAADDTDLENALQVIKQATGK